MAEFEDSLNSILSNPALMGQIMSMANSLGQGNQNTQESKPPPPQPQQAFSPGGWNLDPGTIQSMMSLLRSTGLDQRQQKLLSALQGYLPSDRMEKLSRAMQAAKIAKLASAALSQGR